MIKDTIQKFHDYRHGKFDLADLLHDDCVFISPIVFSPQKGKEISMMYLKSAGNVFSQSKGEPASDKKPFAYIKEVIGEKTAVLEFETTIDGLYMNGIDMITVDDAGLITEFKVMIRPLQAINAIHAQMGAQLKAMQEAAG
jgi:hypothetical protein